MSYTCRKGSVTGRGQQCFKLNRKKYRRTLSHRHLRPLGVLSFLVQKRSYHPEGREKGDSELWACGSAVSQKNPVHNVLWVNTGQRDELELVDKFRTADYRRKRLSHSTTD